MKRAIWMLAVAGAVGAFALSVTVSAHRARVRTVHVPTKITHDGSVNLGNGKFLFSGQVRSREVCQMNRVVKLKAHYPNGRTDLLDLDTTSDAGAWAAKAVDISGADRLKVRVGVAKYERRYPSPPPGTVCKAASVVWRVA